MHVCTHHEREPGDPGIFCASRTHREAERYKAMVNKPRKSDRVVVPAKSSNKGTLNAQVVSAEKMEGRTLTEGNSPKQNTNWIQSQKDVQNALERIRDKARADKELKFTSLMHNIYSQGALFAAFKSLDKKVHEPDAQHLFPRCSVCGV